MFVIAGDERFWRSSSEIFFQLSKICKQNVAAAGFQGTWGGKDQSTSSMPKM
jgi:hypothetical protein